MSEFGSKVALVTGAGSGIGRAAALAFAERGARVTVADVDEPAAAETVRLIEQAGGDAAFAHTDVSSPEEVERMVDDTLARWGRLDCAFNNAGITDEHRSIVECSITSWSRVLAVNLTGVWLCMKYEVPAMLRSGGGAIVNTASSLGEVSAPNTTPYTASKHGVVGITKTVALELAQRGIRVNAVLPGLTDTPIIANVAVKEAGLLAQQPVGRMGTPAEVAAAVLWLCSDEASFVTGHPMAVDGGYLAH